MDDGITTRITGKTRSLRAVAVNHDSLHPRVRPGTVGGMNTAVEGGPHHRDEFNLPTSCRSDAGTNDLVSGGKWMPTAGDLRGWSGEGSSSGSVGEVARRAVQQLLMLEWLSCRRRRRA